MVFSTGLRPRRVEWCRPGKGSTVRKRTTLQWLSIASLCLAASAASAVTIDWTFVGNPGNACDTQSQGCFGSVGYGYSIATFEVTNAQYTAFLNAVADTAANALSPR